MEGGPFRPPPSLALERPKKPSINRVKNFLSKCKQINKKLLIGSYVKKKIIRKSFFLSSSNQNYYDQNFWNVSIDMRQVSYFLSQ